MHFIVSLLHTAGATDALPDGCTLIRSTLEAAELAVGGYTKKLSSNQYINRHNSRTNLTCCYGDKPLWPSYFDDEAKESLE